MKSALCIAVMLATTAARAEPVRLFDEGAYGTPAACDEWAMSIAILLEDRSASVVLGTDKFTLMKCPSQLAPDFKAMLVRGASIWRNCAIAEFNKQAVTAEGREAAVDLALDRCRHIAVEIARDMHRMNPRFAGAPLRQFLIEREAALRDSLLSR